MKFYEYKDDSGKVATASLESLMVRNVLDERDIDYLNHLEIDEVNIATEGIVRAGAHNLGSVLTDSYREIKGWVIGTESKRKYIIEICDDLIDWLKGKDVDYAMNVLKFSQKESAEKLLKLLKSAIANWQVKNEGQRLEDAQLYVKAIVVDSGRMLKRIRTAPQGRAI